MAEKLVLNVNLMEEYGAANLRKKAYLYFTFRNQLIAAMKDPAVEALVSKSRDITPLLNRHDDLVSKKEKAVEDSFAIEKSISDCNTRIKQLTEDIAEYKAISVNTTSMETELENENEELEKLKEKLKNSAASAIQPLLTSVATQITHISSAEIVAIHESNFGLEVGKCEKTKNLLVYISVLAGTSAAASILYTLNMILGFLG